MPENVWALCRIGDSTKKVDGGAKGFIGEKGIGFKSAFKVADRVWVKSGALSFMFDKNKRLGMIAPEWADIPEQKLIQDRTVFCFQIPEAKHRRGVRSDIVQLKPALLLFLRKLRTIHVTVQDDNGDTTLACRLSRADDSVSGIRRTILQRDTTVNRPNKYGKNKPSTAKEGFLVFQSTVKNMPAETKRHGVSETELLMAFPVDGDMKPFLRNRDTFNCKSDLKVPGSLGIVTNRCLQSFPFASTAFLLYSKATLCCPQAEKTSLWAMTGIASSYVPPSNFFARQ